MLKRLFDDLVYFPLMCDEFVGAVNNCPYSFNYNVRKGDIECHVGYTIIMAMVVVDVFTL